MCVRVCVRTVRVPECKCKQPSTLTVEYCLPLSVSERERTTRRKWNDPTQEIKRQRIDSERESKNGRGLFRGEQTETETREREERRKGRERERENPSLFYFILSLLFSIHCHRLFLSLLRSLPFSSSLQLALLAHFGTVQFVFGKGSFSLTYSVRSTSFWEGEKELVALACAPNLHLSSIFLSLSLSLIFFLSHTVFSLPKQQQQQL